MATEIEPLIMPFDPLWVTTSKREYREAVRRMGEEPGDTKGKDGLTSCILGKGCVIWISRKVKAPDLYALAAHEATHAACDMLASIGEDTPAAEELAYMVQTITAGIIIACGGSDGDDVAGTHSRKPAITRAVPRRQGSRFQGSE